MEKKLIIDQMKDLLNEDYLSKLTKIIDSYEIIKEHSSFIKKLSFKNYHEEKAKNIPQYTLFFINVLIENVEYILNKENNIYNNKYLHIVISYLFKIILSKFNFIPSHKLVIIIYRYLCNSLMKFRFELNFEDEIKKINKDFCFIYHSFEEKILDEKNKNIINEKKDFNTNIDAFYELDYKENCFKNPCFKFFTKFIDMSKLHKYFCILILNYLKAIDNNNEINNYILLYYLYKRYFNDIIISQIDKKIEIIEKEVEMNEVKNKNVHDILIYSLKILDAKNKEDIKKIANELILINNTEPKMVNFFDNSNEYYKDLLNELFYKIKKLEKCPEINYSYEIKNYWCSIIKIISIIIQQNDIENIIVKIIFYFIVKLMDDNLKLLQEKEFLSNNLYVILDLIFKDKRVLFLYPEISYLLNDNQDIYNFFLCEKNEEYFFNMIENYIEETNLMKIKSDEIYKIMKNINYKNIFISITAEYILEKSISKNFESIIEYNFYMDINNDNNSLNIFYKIYLYYNRIYFNDFQLVNLNYKTSNFNETKTYKYMNNILINPKIFNLLENIMNSKVMNEAYTEISKLGIIIKNKDNKNNYDIYKCYCNFIKDLKSILKNNIFILLRLTDRYKGIICRFFKIIINSQDVHFNEKENNENDNIKLLTAYLIFIIIQEFYQFMKIIYNFNFDEYNTGNTSSQNEESREFINLLFGGILLNKKINLSQAEYILDINNWKNKSLTNFREDYSKIKPNNKSIHYSFFDEDIICYYGFIKPDN